MYGESITIRGDLETIIEDKGVTTVRLDSNTVVMSGKSAVVKSLAYDIGPSFRYYVNRMIFGNGGEESGVPRTVSVAQTALFGVRVAELSATPSQSPDVENQVTFTSVLTTSHANDQRINEAALEMANGSLFSIITFGGIDKTSTMTLTYNWTLTVV